MKIGTLKDDQNRRDFTINSLAIGISKKNFGELIDPFNGINDLKDKIIRTPLNPDTPHEVLFLLPFRLRSASVLLPLLDSFRRF